MEQPHKREIKASEKLEEDKEAHSEGSITLKDRLDPEKGGKDVKSQDE